MWAESSHREVRYALCEDKPTLIWFANQRAVEYHVTLGTAGHLDRPSYLVLDIDPPAAGEFGRAVAAARLVREALSGAGLAGAVKTSGAKGVHVYVPVQESVSADDAAAATRALAERAVRLDPGLATTAFIKADRGGLVFIDSTRAHGATVVAAYSPRAHPGVPVSFPVAWDSLDEVSPGTSRCGTRRGCWRALIPGPCCSAWSSRWRRGTRFGCAGLALLAMLAASVLVLAAFTGLQIRRQRAGRAPLVEPSIFGHRSYRAGIVFLDRVRRLAGRDRDDLGRVPAERTRLRPWHSALTTAPWAAGARSSGPRSAASR